MALDTIEFDELRVHTHHLWNSQWLLLATGDFEGEWFNVMTVGWGSIGTVWERPFVQVFVRPTRHTFGFIEDSDTFTISAFPEKYRDDLWHLGTKSGREGDKLEKTSLTPIAAESVAAPAFEEAELVIECRKIYTQDLDASNFLARDIEKHYPEKDYHRVYYGEIVTIRGVDRFRAAARPGIQK